MEYNAIIKNIDDWWVGWIEEVPGVNCQEKTKPSNSIGKTLSQKPVKIF